MVAPMDFLQIGPIHMGIDLCRRDIRVAQHGLHRAEIRAALEQMRGKRVAQRVRGHPLLNPSGQSVAMNQLPERLTGQCLA